MLENFLWFMGKERRYSCNSYVSRPCVKYHLVEGMLVALLLAGSLWQYKVQRGRVGRLVTKSAPSCSPWIPSSDHFCFVLCRSSRFLF